MADAVPMENDISNRWFYYTIAVLIIAAVVVTFLYLYTSKPQKPTPLVPPPSHALGFSIYTNQTSLLTLFKSYYSNSSTNSLLIDDVYGSPPERS